MAVVKVTKRNRKTGTEIRLHTGTEIRLHTGTERTPTPSGIFFHRWYQCECAGHGFLSTEEIYTKTAALKLMARPDEWCVGCMEGWPAEDE